MEAPNLNTLSLLTFARGLKTQKPIASHRYISHLTLGVGGVFHAKSKLTWASKGDLEGGLCAISDVFDVRKLLAVFNSSTTSLLTICAITRLILKTYFS